MILGGEGEWFGFETQYCWTVIQCLKCHPNKCSFAKVGKTFYFNLDPLV